MPAKKVARQSVRRYFRNHGLRRNARGAVGYARRAIAAGDSESAETSVHSALSTLDRAVKKGVLHKNNGSRRKSRLALQLNRMQRASS